MSGVQVTIPGNPAAQVAAPGGAPAVPEKPKRERKTRKDFADAKSFAEYKLHEANGALERAKKKVELWTKKLANPGASDLDKQEKKVAKLLSALEGLKASNPAAYAAAEAMLRAQHAKPAAPATT